MPTSEAAASSPDRSLVARRRAPAIVLLLVVLVAAGLAGCGASETGPPAASAPPTTRLPLPVDFSQPGPYQVGTVTLNIGDRDAVVYYPAQIGPPFDTEHVDRYDAAEAIPAEVRDLVPAALLPAVTLDAFRNARASSEGPFPVVIHSHDAGSYYLFESRHFEQLASWGFVVAAPDHQERAIGAPARATDAAPAAIDQDVTDLRNTWQALRDENVKPGGTLKGVMNLDDLAAEGDGVGARTAARFAGDPAVTTFIGQAPVAPLDGPVDPQVDLLAPLDQRLQAERDGLAAVTPPAKPSMLITGDQDHVVPVDLVRAEHEWLAPPTTLAVLRNAGHHAFSDLCPPIRAQGGVARYQASLAPAFRGLLQLDDGCLPANLDPERGYALVNQLTIAQLRWVFKVDPDRTSLDPDFLERTFGDALASIEHTAS